MGYPKCPPSGIPYGQSYYFIPFYFIPKTGLR